MTNLLARLISGTITLGQQQPANLGREGLGLVWLLQGAVLLGAIGVGIKIGASSWFLGTGVVAFLVIALTIDWYMWNDMNMTRPASSRSFMFHFMAVGTWLPSVIMSVVLVAVILRIDWGKSIVAGAFICAFLLLIAIYTLLLGKFARHHHSTQWFQRSVGAALLPLFVAWLGASAVSAWVKPLFRGGVSASLEEEYRKDALDNRTKWKEHTGWKKPDGQPITVAVLLSGGGYRAAAFHVGVLKALDEKCVPIRYLSTVSGGSIIGAYYALGYPPELFKKRLIDQHPGLPDEMLNIRNVIFDLLVPTWNSAKTYARHFERAFFNDKALSDTGHTPQLVVNATDLEGPATDMEEPARREVFFLDRNPKYPELNKTKLADIVAASAAFPGAFQPKTLSWPAHDSDDAPRSRRFIDGGVVENLGDWGLAHFHHVNKTPKEDILIVSDASAETPAGSLPQKVELLELLSLSQAISDDTKHGLLLANVKENQERIILRLAETLYPSEAKSVLRERWYPSPTDPEKVAGDEVAKQVAQIPTLNELNEEQVKRASWVGYSLAQDQWVSINNFRTWKGGKGPECPGQ